MSASEASLLMGLPISQPTAPEGFEEVASRYYGDPETGGSFIVMFESASGSLVVYQEAASSGRIVAGNGSTKEVTLPDGTNALLMEGGWTVDGSRFEWSSGSDRSLVFERNGVRTVVSAQGDDISVETLVDLASGMR
jgi:hypothetical protein